MPLIYNGTTVTKVIYNGTELDKVVYNGVTVWEKATPSFLHLDFSTASDSFTNGSLYFHLKVKGEVKVTVMYQDSTGKIVNKTFDYNSTSGEDYAAYICQLSGDWKYKTYAVTIQGYSFDKADFPTNYWFDVLTDSGSRYNVDSYISSSTFGTGYDPNL